MSREALVAKRYAKALFELARDKGVIAQVENHLKIVVDTINSNKELDAFLKHPGVDSKAKFSVLQNAFGHELSGLVMDTLRLLISKGRETVLPELLKSYVTVAGEALGQADAVVSSMEPLTAEQSAEIAAKFGQITGKTIRIENVIDKSLLGGIQVRIGDRLYDGSLSGKLARLEQSLKQAQAL
ncbi:F0F1 ATP synthase subunit delta [Paenibacillus gansuensis]|uniref:ATP synthase subunit delta n=1 Tax=Paenibacillus gansuensis TaxID=306542 RepID=A0ABW5PKE0_9BACL